MDNKEAIYRIQDHMRVHRLYEPNAFLINEALNLAIKALHERESLFYECDDAIDLLKAQQPMVMTPENFDNNPMVDENGKLPAWIEYKRYNGVMRSADGWGTINRNWVKGYNDRRFWTSRPTDEQRKEAEWE